MKPLIRVIWESPTDLSRVVSVRAYNSLTESGDVGAAVRELIAEKEMSDPDLSMMKVVAVEQEGETKKGQFWKKELSVAQILSVRAEPPTTFTEPFVRGCLHRYIDEKLGIVLLESDLDAIVNIVLNSDKQEHGFVLRESDLEAIISIVRNSDKQ